MNKTSISPQAHQPEHVSCRSAERRHNLSGTGSRLRLKRSEPKRGMKWTQQWAEKKHQEDQQAVWSGVLLLEGAMESRGLAHIIHQLQEEIRKLETENRTLRGQVGPPETEASDERDTSQETQNHANLRRNVSAPALEGQYKENIIMTVRRYSISSNMIHMPRKNTSLYKARSNGDTVSVGEWSKQHGGERGLSHVGTEERDKVKDKPLNRRSLQQRISKARAKEKTVTFLLPVDDIYTNRPISASHLNDTSS